jgi:hypothetical protein
MLQLMSNISFLRRSKWINWGMLLGILIQYIVFGAIKISPALNSISLILINKYIQPWINTTKKKSPSPHGKGRGKYLDRTTIIFI